MTNKNNVVRLDELITMMHYTIDCSEVMFNKPFKDLIELREFINWLSNKGVMDTRIISPDGYVLTQEECIGRDHFILSNEAIAVCTNILKIFQPKTRTLLTAGTEEQVSLILKRSEKITSR